MKQSSRALNPSSLFDVNISGKNIHNLKKCNKMFPFRMYLQADLNPIATTTNSNLQNEIMLAHA